MKKLKLISEQEYNEYMDLKKLEDNKISTKESDTVFSPVIEKDKLQDKPLKSGEDAIVTTPTVLNEEKEAIVEKKFLPPPGKPEKAKKQIKKVSKLKHEPNWLRYWRKSVR